MRRGLRVTRHASLRGSAQIAQGKCNAMKPGSAPVLLTLSVTLGILITFFILINLCTNILIEYLLKKKQKKIV